MSAVWQRIDIRLLAVMTSLVISGFTLFFVELPNDDAYVYVRTAQIFLDEGAAAAFAHYGWAGYSILIGMVSQLGIPLFSAAYLINAALFALLVYTFVSLAMKLSDDPRIAQFAALTVLLYPELNEFRHYVIRDIGFWAFSLFGLLQFMRFREAPDSRSAMRFITSLLLATLFRAEAALYLAVMPLTLLVDPALQSAQRKQLFWILGRLVYGAGIAITVALLIMGVNLPGQVLEFFSVYLPFIQGTFDPTPAETAELGRLLFGEYAATFSQEYMTGVIAAGLLVILAMSVFYGISGAYFWLLVYGAWKRYLPIRHSAYWPALAYIAVNTLILLCFLYITRYLSSRYAMLLSVLLVLLLPFVVVRLQDAAGSKSKLVRSLLILFFAFCFFDAHVSFGRSRDYLLDSANYVSGNLNPANTVLTNNHTIAYFSGQVPAFDEVERILTSEQISAMAPGDLLAVEMIAEMRTLLAGPEMTEKLQPIASFPAQSPQVIVYRRTVQ